MYTVGRTDCCRRVQFQRSGRSRVERTKVQETGRSPEVGTPYSKMKFII
jgi:hypothetical protein